MNDLPLPKWIIILSALHRNKITLTNSKFENDINVTNLQKILLKDYGEDLYFSNLHLQIRQLERVGLVKTQKTFFRVLISLTNKGIDTAKHCDGIVTKIKQTKVKEWKKI